MQAQRRQQRHRPPRSCVECRRRKIKCDRNQPCSQCVLSKCRCLYDGGIATSRHPGRPGLSFPGSDSVSAPSFGESRTGYPGLHHDQHLPAMVSNPEPRLTASLSEGQRSHEGREGEGDDDELTGQLTSRLRSLEERLSKYAAEVVVATGMTSDLGSSRSRNLNHEHGENNDEYHALPTGPEDGDPLVLYKSRLFGQTHWSNSVREVRG
jgi:hypothetical protein